MSDTTDSPDAKASPVVVKPPSSRGCLWMSIIPLWFLVLGGWMYWHLRGQVKEMRTFLDTAPVSVEPVQPTAEELTTLRGRIAAFGAKVQANETATLELSAPEINQLLGGQDPLNRLKDLVKVTEIGEVIRFRVSLAINGMPFSGERLYLNGEMTARPEIVKGKGPVLVTKSLEAGKPVTDGFRSKYLDASHLDSLFLEEARKDPAVNDVLLKVTTVRTADGKLIAEFVPPAAPAK